MGGELLAAGLAARVTADPACPRNYGLRMADNPRTVVVGVVTRTGAAVVIVLDGTGARPGFVSRAELDLTGPGEDIQPYHAAGGLELADAAALIGRAERGAEEAAAAGLRRVHDRLPGGTMVADLAVAVKPVALPGTLAATLRSHAWMHAAEGVLYREAVLAAARRRGWTVHAVELSVLASAAADQEIAEIGQVAGRPWRRIEKDATRTAISIVRSTGPRGH